MLFLHLFSHSFIFIFISAFIFLLFEFFFLVYFHVYFPICLFLFILFFFFNIYFLIFSRFILFYGIPVTPYISLIETSAVKVHHAVLTKLPTFYQDYIKNGGETQPNCNCVLSQHDDVIMNCKAMIHYACTRLKEQAYLSPEL